MNSQSESTNESLLSRARRKDSQAWDELVQLYGPLIVFWLRRSGLDVQQSSDGVQEVFAAVIRGLSAYQPKRESGSFRAWLWTITRNKVRDFHRRNSHLPTAQGGSAALRELNEIPDSLYNSDSEPTDDNQYQLLVARALAQVQPEFEDKTWRIFHRSVIDRISSDLVAEEFGVTPAAVRKVRSRILRRLRQQLGDIEDTSSE
ncbi:MAG: sigma-70 family RNA polymerase sigma factor [Pirellulales bacterium]